MELLKELQLAAKLWQYVSIVMMLLAYIGLVSGCFDVFYSKAPEALANWFSVFALSYLIQLGIGINIESRK